MTLNNRCVDGDCFEAKMNDFFTRQLSSPSAIKWNPSFWMKWHLLCWVHVFQVAEHENYDDDDAFQFVDQSRIHKSHDPLRTLPQPVFSWHFHKHSSNGEKINTHFSSQHAYSHMHTYYTYSSENYSCHGSTLSTTAEFGCFIPCLRARDLNRGNWLLVLHIRKCI